MLMEKGYLRHHQKRNSFIIKPYSTHFNPTKPFSTFLIAYIGKIISEIYDLQQAVVCPS